MELVRGGGAGVLELAGADGAEGPEACPGGLVIGVLVEPVMLGEVVVVG